MQPTQIDADCCFNGINRSQSLKTASVRGSCDVDRRISSTAHRRTRVNATHDELLVVGSIQGNTKAMQVESRPGCNKQCRNKKPQNAAIKLLTFSPAVEARFNFNVSIHTGI